MKKENKRLQFAQKIGMTILLLLLIRFMSHIPVPGVKHDMFKLAVAGKGNGYFQLYDRLTGGRPDRQNTLLHYRRWYRSEWSHEWFRPSLRHLAQGEFLALHP